MEDYTEREFSFKNFCVYALRRWIVLVLCTVIGTAAGALYAISKTAPDDEIFIGSINLSVADYVNSKVGDTAPNEAEVTMYSTQAHAILSLAADDEIKNAVFVAMKDRVFSDIKVEKDQRARFFTSMEVVHSREPSRVKIAFAYPVETEADSALAQEVVKIYLEKAQEKIIAAHPQFEGENPILTVSAVTRDYDESNYEELLKDSESPSLVSSILIGLIAGIVVGVGIIVLIYATDRKVKSVVYLLPDGKNRVISANQSAIDNNSILSLLALVRADANIKKLLIASPLQDGKVDEYADALCMFAESMGIKTTLIKLDDTKDGWKDKLTVSSDALTVYAYGGGEALGYVACHVDACCMLLNQASVSAKEFKSAFVHINDSPATYLGTVVYSLTKSFLD